MQLLDNTTHIVDGQRLSCQLLFYQNLDRVIRCSDTCTATEHSIISSVCKKTASTECRDQGNDDLLIEKKLKTKRPKRHSTNNNVDGSWRIIYSRIQRASHHCIPK